MRWEESRFFAYARRGCIDAWFVEYESEEICTPESVRRLFRKLRLESYPRHFRADFREWPIFAVNLFADEYLAPNDALVNGSLEFTPFELDFVMTEIGACAISRALAKVSPRKKINLLLDLNNISRECANILPTTIAGLRRLNELRILRSKSPQFMETLAETGCFAKRLVLPDQSFQNVFSKISLVRFWRLNRFRIQQFEYRGRIPSKIMDHALPVCQVSDICEAFAHCHVFRGYVLANQQSIEKLSHYGTIITKLFAENVQALVPLPQLRTLFWSHEKSPKTALDAIDSGLFPNLRKIILKADSDESVSSALRSLEEFHADKPNVIIGSQVQVILGVESTFFCSRIPTLEAYASWKLLVFIETDSPNLVTALKSPTLPGVPKSITICFARDTGAITEDFLRDLGDAIAQNTWLERISLRGELGNFVLERARLNPRLKKVSLHDFYFDTRLASRSDEFFPGMVDLKMSKMVSNDFWKELVTHPTLCCITIQNPPDFRRRMIHPSLRRLQPLTLGQIAAMRVPHNSLPKFLRCHVLKRDDYF